MSISGMAGRLMTVYRRTGFLVDSTDLSGAPASVPPDRPPAVGSFIQVTVTGSTVFGTFSVVGTVGGVPTTEVLTFTQNGSQDTVARFDAGGLTSVDPVGWVDGSFTVSAVGSDGGRQAQRYAIATSVRCHLNRGAARFPNTDAGTAEVERTWLAHDWTTAWAPREGDVYVDQGSSEQWRVVGDPNWLGSLRPHHWEVRVMRREGSLDT